MTGSNSGPAAWLTISGFFASALLLALGLIFLCAAVDNPARIPVAAALLIVGAGVAMLTAWRWRQARRLAPDILDTAIADLAASSDAEVTVAQVVSGLDVPENAARAALARLEAQGLTHPERRDERTVYVFPGLQESKVVRRCTYCGNEYSVREPLHKCPNCGGTLEIVKR
jgi:hypothetical protein